MAERPSLPVSHRWRTGTRRRRPRHRNRRLVPRLTRSLSDGHLPWRNRIIMPCRFRDFAIILRRRMVFIVSMAAHTAQIAMTDPMKRMSDFPPPMSYRLPFVQSCLAGSPAGTTVL